MKEYIALQINHPIEECYIPDIKIQLDHIIQNQDLEYFEYIDYIQFVEPYYLLEDSIFTIRNKSNIDNIWITPALASKHNYQVGDMIYISELKTISDLLSDVVTSSILRWIKDGMMDDPIKIVDHHTILLQHCIGQILENAATLL